MIKRLLPVALLLFALPTSAAITFVNQAEVRVLAGTGTQACTLPASMLEDDLLLVALANDFDLTVTPDGIASGQSYINVDKPSAANPGLEIAYKFMGATPDTVLTIEKHGTSRTACVTNAWRGVCLINPFDVVGFTSASSGNGDPDSPSITTLTDTAVVLSVGMQDDDGTVVLNAGPSGYSNAINGDTDDSVGANVSVAWVEKTTKGAEDPGTWDLDTADAWRAYSIALCPADKTGAGECCEVIAGRTRRMF